MKKYLVPNKVKFTKLGIQLKITRYANKKQNIVYMVFKNQCKLTPQNMKIQFSDVTKFTFSLDT